jgi:hypothetical protein
MMMNNVYDHNQEVSDSYKTAAKAFALGAVMILTFALAGAPGPAAEAIAGAPFLSAQEVAAAPVAVEKAARASPEASDSSDNGHIDVPFTSNQGDVEELPPQF